MCGIIGYLGQGIAQDSLIDGLKRLEYRATILLELLFMKETISRWHGDWSSTKFIESSSEANI